MNLIHTTAHCIRYGTWLVGQIFKESTVMAIDTLGTGRNIAPVILYYPLRVTSEQHIAGFIASITMTPGTLALGVTGPKEVDYDAIAGHRGTDASAVAESEFGTHGLTTVQRFLAIHAMYGSDPEELMASLADMEERLAPHVKNIPLRFNVEYLVERGRKGPRGFRGSRGGRAQDETVFDVEKVDSTPHAAAFVAAILEANDDEKNVEDLKNMDRMERYEVARRNAERARAAKKRDATGAPQAQDAGAGVAGSAGGAPGAGAPGAGDAGATSTRRTTAGHTTAGHTKAAGSDIDTFRGDNLGASLSDRQGRTKPGETLYDPLYPENNPKDGTAQAPAPRHWTEVRAEETAAAARKRAKRERKRKKGRN